MEDIEDISIPNQGSERSSVTKLPQVMNRQPMMSTSPVVSGADAPSGAR
jgi:hypothetical protein